MRVAAIDIGTNTALLLVAERGADGTLSPVVERATITRLGEGVDRTRTFAPAAVVRTRQCIDEYARLVMRSGVSRVAVVGTSAMRDAGGGEELRAQVRASFGVDVRVLNGKEEARLTFRGALSGLAAVQNHGELAVFDVGGGSTEVVIGAEDAGGSPRLRFSESFDVGSVRLTERLVTSDPPAPAEVDAIRETVTSAFEHVPPLAADATPIGVAGTVTTLAAVALGLSPYDGARVHGVELSVERLRGVTGMLSRIDLAARRALPGMEPKRADVIVAGAYIVLALLDHWRSRAMIVSDRGVRWGLAQELADASS